MSLRAAQVTRKRLFSREAFGWTLALGCRPRQDPFIDARKESLGEAGNDFRLSVLPSRPAEPALAVCRDDEEQLCVQKDATSHLVGQNGDVGMRHFAQKATVYLTLCNSQLRLLLAPSSRLFDCLCIAADALASGGGP